MQKKNGLGGLLLIIIIGIGIYIWLRDPKPIDPPIPPQGQISEIGEWKLLNTSIEGPPTPTLVTFSSTGVMYNNISGETVKYKITRTNYPYLLETYNNFNELQTVALISYINYKTMKWGKKMVQLPPNSFGTIAWKSVRPSSYDECNQVLMFERTK